MKISEIKQDHEAESVWGVELDEEMFDPPASIRSISLLWEGTSPKDITDRLIDTIIAFTLSGAEVIVEVRPTDEVDYNYLLTLAGNAGFSVAAIPPETEVDLDAWKQHCAGFTEAILTVPNFSKNLFPVTGYMTYLTLEFFGGADALEPTDPYTIERFYKGTPTEWADAAKSDMREQMSNLLGGEDMLKEYLGSILKAIQDSAKTQILDALNGQNSSE